MHHHHQRPCQNACLCRQRCACSLLIRPRRLLIGLVRGLFDFVSVGSTSSSSTTSQGFFNPFGLREIAAHPPHMTTTLPVCLRRCALSHPAHPISPLDSTPHLRYPTSHSTSSQAIVRSTAHSARPLVCTAGGFSAACFRVCLRFLVLRVSSGSSSSAIVHQFGRRVRRVHREASCIVARYVPTASFLPRFVYVTRLASRDGVTHGTMVKYVYFAVSLATQHVNLPKFTF